MDEEIEVPDEVKEETIKNFLFLSFL